MIKPTPPPMRRARDGGGILALIKPYTFWNIGDLPPLTMLGRAAVRLGLFDPAKLR